MGYDLEKVNAAKVAVENAKKELRVALDELKSYFVSQDEPLSERWNTYKAVNDTLEIDCWITDIAKKSKWDYYRHQTVYHDQLVENLEEDLNWEFDRYCSKENNHEVRREDITDEVDLDAYDEKVEDINSIKEDILESGVQGCVYDW